MTPQASRKRFSNEEAAILADIIYTYRNKVYLNLTNRCPCSCTFCIRSNADGLGSANTLWHKSDPTAEEITAAIESFDFSGFPEVTFCGYGEPLCAFDNLVMAGKLIKRKYPDIKVRINTNGLGNLVNEKDTVPALAEFTDTVSISLNAPNAKRYNEISRPKYGARSFEEILRFAEECKKYIPTVKFSVVDVIPPEEIDECQKIADKMDIPLRVRTKEN